ncbi:MAG: sugar phosphate isomerase/epimerase [Gemmatimonadetes bacterium]|nr:sugar phosphate isomerase/epimerase [Gemmatimonadota bacterium]MYA76593.1 sugar phosphate isomerase/epimerase [Gemmatimonadota bacterium]MYG17751.1 sugar phosphate isomerase/epimerase [Gemmatimonadota bacterium]MYH18310.1 sugar phosphate isomerase/epimerase [Gemmatimonadota bacterium]MYK99913.1 sugar phosphate isomerase/epimerase [Gemmatimonadota bacterium]
MRLGVVGYVPGDPRAVTEEVLKKGLDLGVTSVCYHGSGEVLDALTTEDCNRVNALYNKLGLELAQLGIGYRECLFDPDGMTRDRIVKTIGRGIEAGRALMAHNVLIRTGSLNPAGSYDPTPENHEPGRLDVLIDTLTRVADKADEEGMTVVIETHVLTIMGSPEINRKVIEAVGSDRLRVVMDFVNHFQSLDQAYNSADRLNHIFDVMGPISTVSHIKDISVEPGFVLHMNEEVPGAGVLDLVTAVRRWEEIQPEGYMLVEHLPEDKIPTAVANVRRIAAEAGVEIV